MSKLPFLITNGAGPDRDILAVTQLSMISEIDDLTLGTHTPTARGKMSDGENFIVKDDGTSFNRVRLANRGAGSMVATLTYTAGKVKIAGKRFVASVFGFTTDEIVDMVWAAWNAGADIVEIDAGCSTVTMPNGRPIGDSPKLLQDILAAIAATNPHIPLRLKLPPYTTAEERVVVAAVIRQFPQVESIVVCNTMQGKFINDSGTFAFGGEEGGIGGTDLLPYALANAKHFVELLGKTFCVIGAGGIRGWTTAKSFLDVGCKGIAVATAYYHKRDPSVFTDIRKGYLEWAQSS